MKNFLGFREIPYLYVEAVSWRKIIDFRAYQKSWNCDELHPLSWQKAHWLFLFGNYLVNYMLGPS